MFLLTYSKEGKLAHAINLATFLILWSGSRIRNTASVITMKTSTIVFFIKDLSMDLFSYYELSFSSLQWKNAHYGFPVHIFVSYCNPRWNLPSTTGPPVSGSFSYPLEFLYAVSAIKSGIRSIKSYKFIDGLQSSSDFGMICVSKSLPSANEGNENYKNGWLIWL